MLRASTVAVVGALLALGTASPAGAVTGEQRVLVVLATWGPTPFEPAEVRRSVFDAAAAFYRRSSFGKLTLRGEVTPWLRVLPPSSGCFDEWWVPEIPRSVSAPARSAAAARGFQPANYDRVMYVVPGSRCGFVGIGWGGEVLLNGSIDADLVVHELGHTFGLGHAAASQCADLCSLQEDGDVFTPMGIGFSDFSIIEKVRLGWTRNVTAVQKPGTFRIARADVAGSLPYGLRVDTAIGAYWLEYRPEPVDLGFEGVVPGGVVTRFVTPHRSDDPYGTTSVLMERPTGRARPVALLGETIRIPGVLTARFSVRSGNVATVVVRWADRTAPQPPVFTLPRNLSQVGATVRVRWDVPFERGSGVASYRVSVDGTKPQIVRENELLLRELAAGTHFVSVSAVDRAGNRGLASVQRFEVTR